MKITNGNDILSVLHAIFRGFLFSPAAESSHAAELLAVTLQFPYENCAKGFAPRQVKLSPEPCSFCEGDFTN
jgi:hypothetical protein